MNTEPARDELQLCARREDAVHNVPASDELQLCALRVQVVHTVPASDEPQLDVRIKTPQYNW